MWQLLYMAVRGTMARNEIPVLEDLYCSVLGLSKSDSFAP